MLLSFLNKQRVFVTALIVALAVLLFPATNVSAQALLQFSSATQSVVAGGAGVNFSGTITNQTALPLFITGYQLNINAPFTAPTINLDDTALADIVSPDPLQLAASGSGPADTFSGLFFHATADAGTPTGTYDGSLTLFGGDTNISNDVVSLEVLFHIQVLGSAALPEPSAGHLVWLGLSGVFGIFVQRRQHIKK